MLDQYAGLILFLLLGKAATATNPLSSDEETFNVRLSRHAPGALRRDSDNIHHDASLLARSSSACSLLSQLNGGSILLSQESSGYEEERTAHWSATAYEWPQCIYIPGDVDEVISAVEVFNSTESTFAIRSGGHSPLPGWANINGSVLVSLAGIVDMSYDDDTEAVRVGFGNRWGDVYNYLETYGRIVVGGRASTVGMALLTGGGLSHASNEYGFAADNVVSYEVVLSNATAVVASGEENPDLYWALKGGSNNFGIVTHATMATVPSGKVWGGVITYNSSYSEDFMSAMAQYQASGQLDRKSALLPYLAINNGTIISTFVYLDDVDHPDAFQPFYDIPSWQDNTAVFDSFASFINQGSTDFGIPRWTYGTTTFYLDEEMYIDAIQICSSYINSTQDINGATFVVMPQPISLSMVEQSKARGPNPMNVTSSPQLWFTLNLGWNLESDDMKIRQLMIDILDEIEVVAKAQGLWDEFLFLNDAYETQDPLRSYGKSSFTGLEAVSEAYDPGRMFQAQVPGGFKLN